MCLNWTPIAYSYTLVNVDAAIMYNRAHGDKAMSIISIYCAVLLLIKKEEAIMCLVCSYSWERFMCSPISEAIPGLFSHGMALMLWSCEVGMWCLAITGWYLLTATVVESWGGPYATLLRLSFTYVYAYIYKLLIANTCGLICVCTICLWKPQVL